MENQPVSLVQIAARRGTGEALAEVPVRKPSWLKVKSPGGENYAEVRRLMRDLRLHTVWSRRSRIRRRTSA